MIIREWFVSNSSSSSYIISSRGCHKCPQCGRVPVDIIDLIQRNGYDETRVKASGSQAILKEVEDWWEDGASIKIQEGLTIAEASGQVPHLISISYNDETLREILKSEELNGNINIIWRSEE